MPRIFLILFFLLFPFFSQAYQLKGTVTNLEGEPIPYVSVYVQNTTYGTLTNLKGMYFLELKKGKHTLVFQHVGHEKKVVEVNVLGNQELDVKLNAADIQMETVEIQAGKKDPAYEIMKQVIANKKDYVFQFDTYTCETYIKATLEKDTVFRKRDLRKMEMDSSKVDSAALAEVSVQSDSTDSTLTQANIPLKKEKEQIELIESVSQTYFKAPGTYKSVVKAYRDLAGRFGQSVTQISVSGNGTSFGEGSGEITNPYLFYTDVSDADINFYRNLIQAKDLGDRPFISPLHNTLWQITYKYRLEDKFYEDNKVVYKIEVTPRNPIGPYFKGYLFIVDGLWALKSANLEVLPSTLNFFEKFHLIHEYEKTKNSRWVIKREEYLYQIKESRNRFYGHSMAFHKDYQLDIDIPKRFFRNEVRSMEEKALEQDSSYWTNVRPVTLKQKELDYIYVRDSILAYHSSEEYLMQQDSMFNHLGWDNFLFSGIKFRDRARGMTYFFDPLIAQIRPLGVGGYRHAIGGNIRKNFDKGYDLRVGGNLNYGFRNNDLKGEIGVNYTYLPKRFASARIRYGDIYSLVTVFENLATILSRSNFINNRFISVGHSIELVNGLFLSADARYADRRPIDELELAEWSQELFGAENIPQDFSAYKEMLFDIKLRYTPGQKYQNLPYRKVIIGSRWPTFQLQYKKSIPGFFGSELNYDFIELSIRHDYDLATFGNMQWRVRTGRFLNANNLRFPDYKFIRGSDPILFTAPLEFFQLLGPTFSTLNTYFQGLYIHNFNGSLVGKIPLLKRTKLQETAGGGILAIEDNSFFHTEVFAGLQYPFRIKRTRFRIGVYYVTAYSNYENALNGQVKVGVSFYNIANNRWEY